MKIRRILSECGFSDSIAFDSTVQQSVTMFRDITDWEEQPKPSQTINYKNMLVLF